MKVNAKLSIGDWKNIEYKNIDVEIDPEMIKKELKLISSKKTLYYATFDGDFIVSSSGKMTYTSKSYLHAAIKSMLNDCRNIIVDREKYEGPEYGYIRIDMDDLINKLLDNNRLQIHELTI